MPSRDRAEEKRSSRKVADPRGERLRAFRQLASLTQEKVAELGDLDRVEVTRIENGWNAATSTRLCFGLARAFRVWPETIESVLAGELSAEEAVTRIGEAEQGERAPIAARAARLRDRPEWATVLQEARSLARQFYGPIEEGVWESVADVQDSGPFPRPLQPAFVANIAHAISAAQPK